MAKNNGSGAAVAVAKQPFDLKKAMKNNLGFWFILPWLIGFLVFKLYPFAISLYYSFSDYNLPLNMRF